MSRRDSIERYSPLIAGVIVAAFALLCYALLVAPKAKRFTQVSGELKQSSEELAKMEKEISDAKIAGPPVEGDARFEKFGILPRDKPELFYYDLIAYCDETHNDLKLVRPAEYSRPAPATEEQAQQVDSGQPVGRGDKDKDKEQVPQVVINRVPHTVTFSGTFLSAFHLLRKLESYKRLLTVEKVDLVVDNRVGYPRLNGNITIDLFLVSTPVPAPGEKKGESTPTSGGQQTPATGART